MIKRHQTQVFKQFNWKAMLVRIFVNALTLVVTVILTPSMGFTDPRVWTVFFVAIVLGLLNAIIKPIIQFLTLSYIFATYGLVVVFINTIILYMLSWLLPGYFHVDSLLWALFGGAVMGIIGGFLESLFGLTLPIVDEDSVTEPMRNAAEMNKRRKQVLTFEGAAAEEQPLEETPPVLAPQTSSVIEVPTPTPSETTAEEELVPVERTGASQQAAASAAVEPTAEPATEAVPETQEEVQEQVDELTEMASETTSAEASEPVPETETTVDVAESESTPSSSDSEPESVPDVEEEGGTAEPEEPPEEKPVVDEGDENGTGGAA